MATSPRAFSIAIAWLFYGYQLLGLLPNQLLGLLPNATIVWLWDETEQCLALG